MSPPASQHLSRAEYLRGALWGLGAISIWVSWILYTRVGVTSATSKMSPYDLAALLAWIFLKEHISGLRRAGLALIPIGIAAILGAGLFHFETGHWRGHLLFIAASMTWATFAVAMRCSARAGVDATHIAAVVSVVSMVVYLPIYLLFIPHQLSATPWSAIIGQTLFQGIVVSIVSLVAFARAVNILGASLGASFASLVPVLAMLAAIPLLGEIPVKSDVLGIAVITVGVFLASGAYRAFHRGDA